MPGYCNERAGRPRSKVFVQDTSSGFSVGFILLGSPKVCCFALEAEVDRSSETRKEKNEKITCCLLKERGLCVPDWNPPCILSTHFRGRALPRM